MGFRKDFLERDVGFFFGFIFGFLQRMKAVIPAAQTAPSPRFRAMVPALCGTNISGSEAKNAETGGSCSAVSCEAVSWIGVSCVGCVCVSRSGAAGTGQFLFGRRLGQWF